MQPSDVRQRAGLLVERARLTHERGDSVAAALLSREALTVDRDCFAAHDLLAKIELGGEDYRLVLQRFHAHYRPRTYLEIGVSMGDTIALAGEGTMAIGVDPNPRISRPLHPGVRIFRETSNDFFARHDLRAEFNGMPLELAFIDGMHLFEYVLQDFINVERNSAPGTRLLIHDCYPLDEVTAARERSTIFWTGDGWKLIVCLKKYRPDLRVHTLAVPPSGLTVIARLDPGSSVLTANLDAICREIIPLPYSAVESDKRAALNLVPGDWDTARRLLD